MNSKDRWIVLSETIHILRKLKNIKFLGCSRKFYHRFMYIPPSSGEPLPSVNLPFKWIVRRFEVVFWCLEWECCTFERLMKFIQIHQYYTMALTLISKCKFALIVENVVPLIILTVDIRQWLSFLWLAIEGNYVHNEDHLSLLSKKLHVWNPSF